MADLEDGVVVHFILNQFEKILIIEVYPGFGAAFAYSIIVVTHFAELEVEGFTTLCLLDLLYHPLCGI